MTLLRKIWNFDFYRNGNFPIGSKTIFFFVITIGIGYPAVEVLIALGNASSSFNIFNYFKAIQNQTSFSYQSFEEVFPHIWLSVALFCVVFRISFIAQSYFLSKKELGSERFNRFFVTGLSAFVVGVAISMLLVFAVENTLKLAGVSSNPVNYTIEGLRNFIHTHVPALVNVKNRWLAFLLTVFLSGLPGYFIHWLSHKSRFFWLVTHRAHHVMEYLYPTANPPAFNFDFLFQLPSALVGIVVSQLIYTEPLVREIILYNTFTYSFEVFNHSMAHYRFCYSNPVIRNITRLFGDKGVYHLVHHSAFPQDQNINFGGTPFNFWDRLFGTYRKPYQEPPPLGLTNQPQISSNPFRISLSGIAQLLYELKMNKDILTRLRIIFADVYYMPPVTKDFLKLPV